jgi:hypothetical protein
MDGYMDCSVQRDFVNGPYNEKLYINGGEHMALPTKKRQPKQRLEDYSMLIYGSYKIGKSTFCSQMKEPLFLATEPGLEALSVYEEPIPDWTTFLHKCTEIAEGNHHYQTIVVDTVDNLWKCCSEYIKEQQSIQHESDLGYGKGWHMVKEEFFRVLRKLSLLPYGLVLISHAEMEEVKTRVATFHKMMPSLPKSARDMILGWVDIILYAECVQTLEEKTEHILRTKPNEYWVAGDRTENAFHRKLPETLPLDFLIFEKAFYSKQ